MSRRILLADDSVTIQKVIELTFMDDDYEVRAVGNGDEAIAMLTALKVDFVIADVHMPGASGYEVCRRSKELRSEVPVLLLVGTFEPFDEAQARDCGANAYLKKPFDSQELLGRVHELLGPTPPASQPAPPAPDSAAGAPTAAPAAAEPHATPEPAASFAAAASTLSAAEPAAGTGGGTVEAAASWQEFELEAEPEFMPEPWQPPRTPPVPPGTSVETPHFEKPFALGDLDEPEASAASEPLAARSEPAPPAAPAPGSAPASAGSAGSDHTAADAAPGASAAPASAASTLGGTLDDRAFLFDELEESSAQDARPLRATVPEPVSPFFTTSATVAPSGTAAGGGAPGDGDEAAGATIEERAGAPLGQSPFAGSLEETEERVAEHQGHPAFAGDKAGPALAPMELQEPDGNGQPAAASAAPAGLDAAAAPSSAGSASAAAGAAAALGDHDVDRIARRVVELIGDKVVRDIAWEVIPDLAEVVIKDRLRELESQVE
jgi:CheY-like chemotaxis protein